jgi:hypothetical protein
MCLHCSSPRHTPKGRLSRVRKVAQTSHGEEVFSLSSREREEDEQSTHEDYVIVILKLNLFFEGADGKMRRGQRLMARTGQSSTRVLGSEVGHNAVLDICSRTSESQKS